LSNQIDKIDDNPSKNIGRFIMAEIVTEVVRKFETCTLEDTLLLVQYSLKLPRVASSCFLVHALLGVLEANSVLDSIQGMLLWSHAKYTKEEDSKWLLVSTDAQKLCAVLRCPGQTCKPQSPFPPTLPDVHRGLGQPQNQELARQKLAFAVYFVRVCHFLLQQR
jgi:hypothetical protein